MTTYEVPPSAPDSRTLRPSKAATARPARAKLGGAGIRATEQDPRYRGLAARDRRFDGHYFFAVTSTGIYCRPICPARTPKPENVRFFTSRAGAEAAGFRACRRCRPELAPVPASAPAPDEAGNGQADRHHVDAAPDTTDPGEQASVVNQALRLIAAGALDGDDSEASVETLAAELNISTRQLRRIMAEQVGAGPLAVARNRRLQTARLLLETSEMPATDVAFAAGFGSVRQFNDAFRAAFGRTPTSLRKAGPAVDEGYAVEGSGALILRAGHRGPVDLEHLIGWFKDRAVKGLEQVVDERTYRRTVRLKGGHATLGIGPGSPPDGTGRGSITLTIDPDQLRDVSEAIRICRDLADLDADTAAVAQVLSADPVLAPLVAARPGLRIPGVVDGFEMAVRAVLGQQVSVAAATTMAARIIERHGEDYAATGPLTRLFPTAQTLADADLEGLGLTGARKRTLHALAQAVASGQLTLTRHTDRAATRAALLALPGIGPWTADYLALRALGDPDAFPVGDLVLRQSAGRLGLPQSEKALTAHAERWRPWRAYAAIHLWADHHAALTAARQAERASGKVRTSRTNGTTVTGAAASRPVSITRSSDRT